ncbi:MAG: hypothetical protein LBC94_05875 [Desulfovibrio sp.]|jgi:hypothetical protein|nr:hypothetical protein [Desulfovibrio sp.]
MEVCIAVMHGRDIMLSVQDGLVLLDGEIAPIKHLAEGELEKFRAEVEAIPQGGDLRGLQALVNAKRAAFIVSLLGKTVGDDCISELTHILDHVHHDVQEYLNS